MGKRMSDQDWLNIVKIRVDLGFYIKSKKILLNELTSAKKNIFSYQMFCSLFLDRAAEPYRSFTALLHYNNFKKLLDEWQGREKIIEESLKDTEEKIQELTTQARNIFDQYDEKGGNTAEYFDFSDFEIDTSALEIASETGRSAANCMSEPFIHCMDSHFSAFCVLILFIFIFYKKFLRTETVFKGF
jgi:hypothetical protein